MFFSLGVIKSNAQTAFPNLDFAFGNFNNWICYTGYSVTGTPATGVTLDYCGVSGPIAGPPTRHMITAGTGIDSIGLFPIVTPSGGSYSMKIGNTSVGGEAERVQYLIHVPPGTTGFNLQYKIAVVFEDPHHLQEEQPAFQVIAFDSASGAVIPSANNLYISGAALPGFLDAPNTVNYYDTIHFLPWTLFTLNLSHMAGKTVILQVTSLDCSLGGHFGYGYFDVVSYDYSLTPKASNCNLRDSTITLLGPAGYQYYQWFSDDFSTLLNSPSDTSRTFIWTIPNTPQYLNLIVKPFAPTGIPDTIRTHLISRFSVHAAPDSICIQPGGSVQLHAIVAGGSGILGFRWSGNMNIDSSDTPNPIVSTLEAGLCTVEITDSNGCMLTDAIYVNIGPSSNAFRTHDTAVCAGVSVPIRIDGDTAYSYTWTPSSQLIYPATNIGDQFPEFIADSSTIFSIAAHYPGCPDIISHMAVNVEPMPIVSLQNDTLYKNNFSTTSITATVNPTWFSAYTYTWRSNRFIDSPASPAILYTGNIDTTLMLTVNTPLGCTGKDSVFIWMNYEQIASIPNAFSPGSLVNQRFGILHLNAGYSLKSFRIFNRWGKLVFETQRLEEGWDGRVNNTPSPLDVYVYTIEATNDLGKRVYQQGNVSLLR